MLDETSSSKDKKKVTSLTASKADLSEHEESERSHLTSGTSVCHGTEDSLENSKRPCDSFQFTEAVSVLNKFLKLNFNECEKCGAKNPKIRKPTFGWLQMVCAGVYLCLTRQICFFGLILLLLTHKFLSDLFSIVKNDSR